MPDGVVLEHELARQRGIGIERHRRCLHELFVAERADRGRGGRAVCPEQIERSVFRDARVLRGVLRVHGVDVVHGHARDRLAVGDRLRQLNFDRVNAGDVMHDDADRAAVMRRPGSPLVVREAGGEGDEGTSALFEAIGQGVGAQAGNTRRRVWSK